MEVHRISDNLVALKCISLENLFIFLIAESTRFELRKLKFGNLPTACTAKSRWVCLELCAQLRA